MEEKMTKPSDLEALEHAPSMAGEVCETDTHHHDAVFGEITEGGPNYRNVGWIGIIGLMMKTQIGLGVLSIPSVFDTLGLVPGIICLLAIAGITTWSTYMVGVFKLRHREVYGIDDAGYLLFGRIGREVFGGAYCLYYIFITGSAILSLSIGLNAVSRHGACTAVFVAVAALSGFVFSSIRTLGRLTWIAWTGLVSILISVLIVTIAVGIQDRPAAAPQHGPWASDYKLFNNPPFASAISAVASLVFAFGAAPAFFALVSEMRDPRYYTRSLMICQSGVTATYITIGCVVYYFCGSYVASPALGSAGVLVKRVAYGIALPGLFVTTVLLSHLPAKYVFVRILRGSKHLTSNSLTHWGTWIGCTFSINLIAYLIASGIPVFSGLVSLIGALLGSFMTFQPMGCMWLYDNWTEVRAGKSTKMIIKASWSIFIIVFGTFLTIAGTYGSIVGIIESYRTSEGSAGWSCADNSNTV